MNCHVCQGPTDDACERCGEPTCDAHFHDQEYLGLCVTCQGAIEAMPPGELVQWPYRIRKLPPGLPEPFEPPPMPD